MGHLGTLLWKNFRWCRRHWLWTFFFYAVPIGFCAFLLLISQMIKVDNTGDCDFQSIVLPPSHPAFIVSSLVCNTDSSCANLTAGYYPSDELFYWMGSPTRPGVADQGATAQSPPTRLCPGLSYSDTRAKIATAYYYTCQDRSTKATYSSLPTIDLVFRGNILYYPSNRDTDQIMEALLPKYLDGIDSLKAGIMFGNLSNTSQITAGLSELGTASLCYVPLYKRIFNFASRQDALNRAQAYNLTKDAVWAIIQFENTSSDFHYTLIPHYQTRSNLATLYLQALVEAAAIEHLTTHQLTLNVESKMLPRRCHKNTAIYGAVMSVIELVLSLGMVAFAYSLSSEICFEKGAGLLEFLFIAGVSRTTVKLSWLIYGLTFALSLGAILGVIFKKFNEHVIEHTPLLLVIVVLLFYMGALVALCFVISSMLATAQRAGIFTFVILLVAYLAPTWGQLLPSVGYINNILIVRIFSILHCSVTAQISMAYIIAWEQVEIGAQWNALGKSPADGDLFGGLLECMIHHVIQIIYYMLLSWYLDYVAPSKYGFKLPWYFPLLPSFWGCCGQNLPDAAAAELAKTSKADIEPRTDNKSPGIVLRNLTKRYGTKVAVDDLSVNFYQHEITALLGHNGAGKSTTMNMLTGMIGPTSGTALLDGKDMRNDMKAIRRSLGFCPQYDIIYPELSVEEHMKFYGNLKGIKDSKVKDYSNELFTLMKMTHALKTPAGALSGGMKRKLSITISFLGDPTTIILDEPTSAIDPFSRRAIWDVVLRYRAKSTIVISTHYMQEADILGDRIAIINHGVLKCYGTTMYLKAKYGAGFFLNVAHKKSIDAHAVETQLRVHIPCTLKKTTVTETSYAVPLVAARSEHMIEACRYLEQAGAELGIASFGISESTMEQVFFNVAADDVDDNQANMFNGANAATNAPDFTDYVSQQGLILFLTQVWATWVKRAHLTKRSKLGFVFQVLVPLGFTAILVFFNNVIASVGLNGQLVHVNPWATSFKHGELFYSGSVKQDPFLNSWLQYDLGTICMKNSGIGETCLTYTPPFPNSTVDDSNAPPCNCSQCPSNAAGPKAGTVQLKGKDILLDLSGRNITSYLIKSQEVHVIGGFENTNQTTYLNLSCAEILHLKTLQATDLYNFCHSVFANGIENVTFNSTNALMLSQLADMVVQLFSGPSATHTVWAGVVSTSGRQQTQWESDNKYMRSALINGHSNIMLRSMLSSNLDPLTFGISLSTEEVSMTKALSVAQQVAGILLGLFSAFALMMPSFSTILVVVNENDSGNKQLQFLMGLSRLAYWLANFVWDCFLYIISILIVIAFMSIFKDTFNLDLMFYFECAMMFGVGMILMTYVLSFVIKTARFAILLVGMVSPVFTMAAMILMNWKTESWYPTVDNLLTLVPPYFITICLVTVQYQQFLPNPAPLFDWDVLGKKFVLCAIWSAIMLVLVIGFEWGFFRALGRMWSTGKPSMVADAGVERDQDVVNEEKAIHSTRDENQVLAVKSLVKQYGRNGHVAVKGVSFGVNRGQCFGLLGVNGAGKSTLFKMVTGFEKPTAGDASILNYSIFRDAGAVAKHMSYCPQQDTLFESMTPEEHLFLYSRIRGIPASHREDIINKMIAEVGLGAHVGKQSQALSGGNKRKLNFSISLIGYPDVIFLDEMTTGMDPKARRSAWTVLQGAINRGCVAVITSHSMEECESLCNRLVIMVNGQFRCIGGVQYLKDKFGRYYNIKLRLKPTADVSTIQMQIEQSIIGSQKVEEHLCFLEMQCPAENLKLSFLLQFIHDVKDTLGIEDFSVSQTTLEHVFVNMVRDQE